MSRTIARFVFYAVAITLLAWTASLTVSFLTAALPGVFWLVPILGLVVFDGGMIAWLLVFIGYAEGNIQRAVAISLTVIDLIGVGLMVLAEILLDGQQFATAPESLATTAVWGIGIWTILNVAGVVVFHLGDPQARKAMAIQAEKDAIWEGALDTLKRRRVSDQQRLAAELGEALFAEMLAELRADSDADGRPDLVQSRRLVYPELQNATPDEIRNLPLGVNGTPDPNA